MLRLVQLHLVVVDTGPIRFRNNVTMSRGPWPSPRTGAKRDVASSTPNSNRIGQLD
jgi:hypothetical protein